MTRPGGHNGTPLNRFLSDDQIAEVARPRGAASRGVVGVVLLNDFLEPGWHLLDSDRRPTVTVRGQLARHLEHIAGMAGWDSVGIGSDVDAGYGRDESPEGVDSCLDWERLGDAVPAEARDAVLGGNWLRFLRETLPPAG